MITIERFVNEIAQLLSKRGDYEVIIKVKKEDTII